MGHPRASLAPRRVFLGIAALAVAAVGAALVSQHVFDMQPCPWCVLQRLIFLVLAAAALVGAAWPSRAGTGVASAGVIIGAGCGVAAALWQNLVAAATNSCKLTLAEKVLHGLALDSVLPEVFEPRATCADAAVKLLGVPYEFWSLALFVLLGAAAVWCARQAWRA